MLEALYLVVLTIVSRGVYGKTYNRLAVLNDLTADNINDIKEWLVENDIAISTGEYILVETYKRYKTMYQAIDDTGYSNYADRLYGIYKSYYTGDISIMGFSEMLIDAYDYNNFGEYLIVSDAENTETLSQCNDNNWYTDRELEDMSDEEYAELTA